jgi:hypothetical protein
MTTTNGLKKKNKAVFLWMMVFFIISPVSQLVSERFQRSSVPSTLLGYVVPIVSSFIGLSLLFYAYSRE